MNPVRLYPFWYRRLYVAFIIGGLAYCVPYVLHLLTGSTLTSSTGINLWTAIVGAIIIAISVVAIFLKDKATTFLPLYIVYILFSVTTALTVLGTGGLSAPLLPLWSLVLLVAPLFGAYGWLPGLVMIASLTTAIYLSGSLNNDEIIRITLTSIVPLVFGVLLWRNASDDASTKSVKTLATQLSEVANRSEIIVNAIGDGVVAVDGKGVIELINPAAQEMLGWGKQDALHLSYKSVLKLNDENDNELAVALDPIQQVLNTNQQSRGHKITTTTQAGKRLFLSLVASPIGEAGNGAIIVFRDITGERAEEREQAEFISTASHEMRTPVAAIEGYLGLAMNPNTATVDARAHDYLVKAHESAQHLGQLFQDLLDVSKSEDGRMQNNPSVVDIAQFTSGVIDSLTQKAHDKNLDLIFVPKDSYAIKKIIPIYYSNIDNDHLREVLDNLVENAIKYTPKGQVRVDVSGTDDHVVVSVQDTGLGIPPEDVSHLFQKFYRVNNMDRQSIGGTGLGLYLCRRLVEAMQGRIWVESIFGNGSTFYVELPRLNSERAAQLKEEQKQRKLQAVEANKLTESQNQVFTPTTIPVEYQPVDVATQQPALASTQQTPPLQQSALIQQVEIEPLQQTEFAQQTASASQTQTQPQPQMQTQTPQPLAQPARTGPRGEALTREQINDRVRQLEQLAQQQRNNFSPRK